MTDQTPTSGGTGDEPVEFQDTELGAYLNAEPTPQHRPDFWSDLQSDLNAEAATRNGAQSATVQMPVMAADEQPSVLYNDPSTPAAPAGPDPAAPAYTAEMSTEALPTNVVPLDGRRPRSKAAMWLSAAAAILVIGAAAGFLINRDRDNASIAADAADSSDVDDVTDSTEQDDRGDETDQADDAGEDDPAATDDVPDQADTDLPALAADYFGPSTTTTIGDGRFVGFSPDDSAVLLLVDTVGEEPGCEGAPPLTLFSQDLATGIRVPALPAGRTVETGGLSVQLADADGGPGKVYLAEFCDGFQSNTWEANMAANGVISDLVEIDTDDFDPFAPTADEGALILQATAVSSDESLGAFITDRQLSVQRLDGSGESWTAPSQIIADAAAWDPTGQVVAANSEDTVWFWNFRTDEVSSFTSNAAWPVAFNRAGTQLVLNPFDGVDFAASITITTFGDAAVPVPTTPAPTTPVEASCSGAVDLAPLDADALVAAGVPAAAATTAVAIDQAAADCDWSALADLTGPDFTASFGGGDPIEIWQQDEEASGGSMDNLRAILRQPVGSAAEGAELYVWPAVYFAESCDTFTDADRQSLAELGYDEEAIARDCDFADGYVGYRTGIDPSGIWTFFVAGD